MILSFQSSKFFVHLILNSTVKLLLFFQLYFLNALKGDWSTTRSKSSFCITNNKIYKGTSQNLFAWKRNIKENTLKQTKNMLSFFLPFFFKCFFLFFSFLFFFFVSSLILSWNTATCTQRFLLYFHFAACLMFSFFFFKKLRHSARKLKWRQSLWIFFKDWSLTQTKYQGQFRRSDRRWCWIRCLKWKCSWSMSSQHF